MQGTVPLLFIIISIRRPSSPTVRLGDLAEEDFIWDDQLVNEIIEGSSMEPDYAVAITPVAKITGKNYDGVEPYQGRNLELSPLVKLKGMSKNKRYKLCHFVIS